MKPKTSQLGSAFVIIIIVLAVAILGVLGFVFWQNFLNKPVTNTTTSTTTSKTTSSIDSATVKQYVNQKYGVSFNYPSDWTVEVKSDQQSLDTGNYFALSIKDSSGTQVAHFSAADAGVGGTCEPDTQAVDLSVVRTSKLDIMTENTTNFTYMISPTDVGSTQYIGRLGLTPYYTAVGTQKVCPNTIYMLANVKTLGGVTFSSILFSSGADAGFGGKTFASKQEATDYVNIDEYKKLEAMIKSFDFKQ